MNLEGTEDSASRFAAYIEELTSVIGHADRARPMNDYCAGLLVTEGRRSVEPIAAVTAPDKTSVQHHFPRRGSRLKLLDCRRKDSEPVVVPHSLLFVWYFGPANGGETGSWKPCGFLDHQ